MRGVAKEEKCSDSVVDVTVLVPLHLQVVALQQKNAEPQVQKTSPLPVVQVHLGSISKKVNPKGERPRGSQAGGSRLRSHKALAPFTVHGRGPRAKALPAPSSVSCSAAQGSLARLCATCVLSAPRVRGRSLRAHNALWDSEQCTVCLHHTHSASWSPCLQFRPARPSRACLA